MRPFHTLLFLSFLLSACGRPAGPCCIHCCDTQSANPQRAAFDRGIDFLLAKQAADGGWHSEIYGHFRNGDALTPLVIAALQRAGYDPTVSKAIEDGLAFMAPFEPSADSAKPGSPLQYPVYTASFMVKILSDERLKTRTGSRDAWLKILRDWQMTEETGWQRDDWQYGGWGYCGVRPRKPEQGPIPDALEANLSATAFALEAMRSAGVSPKDPLFEKALVFVNRCQNFHEQSSDLAIDDGGFFFTPGDPFRNKAGLANRTAASPRYRSYGSATADGLRCLEACGVYPHAARKRKAAEWLESHLSADEPFRNQGTFADDRLKDRDAAMYYFAASLNAVHRDNGLKKSLNRLRDELIQRQQEDGSWKNGLNAVREDDPILATALALLSLK